MTQGLEVLSEQELLAYFYDDAWQEGGEDESDAWLVAIKDDVVSNQAFETLERLESDLSGTREAESVQTDGDEQTQRGQVFESEQVLQDKRRVGASQKRLDGAKALAIQFF